MTPAAIHASMSQSGDPTLREMSAETMKMPDPIIDPATSIVASVSVMALTNPADDDGVSSVSILSAVLAIRRSPWGVSFRGGIYLRRETTARRGIAGIALPASMTEGSKGFGGLSGFSRSGVNASARTRTSLFLVFTKKLRLLSGGSPALPELRDNPENPPNLFEPSVMDACQE